MKNNFYCDTFTFFKGNCKKQCDKCASEVKETQANTQKIIENQKAKNIENNRGWIKIESEADLPKYYETAWVYSNMIEYGIYNPHQKYWQDTEWWPIKNVTHYQPIEKPQPPIY